MRKCCVLCEVELNLINIYTKTSFQMVHLVSPVQPFMHLIKYCFVYANIFLRPHTGVTSYKSVGSPECSVISWRNCYFRIPCSTKYVFSSSDYTVSNRWSWPNLKRGRGGSIYLQLLRHRKWEVDRIPVEAKFSVFVQTIPGAHPASCTMCTESLSMG
jgi:hypothetical protein